MPSSTAPTHSVREQIAEGDAAPIYDQNDPASVASTPTPALADDPHRTGREDDWSLSQWMLPPDAQSFVQLECGWDDVTEEVDMSAVARIDVLRNVPDSNGAAS